MQGLLRSSSSHWPGGRPARAWAADVLAGHCALEAVPEALRALVRRHVEIAAARGGSRGR